MTDPITVTELKGCPFCGGEADFEQIGSRVLVEGCAWSVGCSNETCLGFQSVTTYARKAEAAAAWNTRHAAEQATRAEVETLRRIIRDTLWMACRYAHGRQSYSVAMYNEAARKADALGVLAERPASDEPIFAIDGSLSREMSGLTEVEFEQAWSGWHKHDAIPNHCRTLSPDGGARG